jgi:hypothetical protein
VLGDIPYFEDFLTDPHVKATLTSLVPKGTTLAKDTKLPGKVFFLDYRDYEPYEYPEAYAGMYIHAPTVIIYEDANKVKQPLGIRFNVPRVLSPDGKWVYF